MDRLTSRTLEPCPTKHAILSQSGPTLLSFVDKKTNRNRVQYFVSKHDTIAIDVEKSEFMDALLFGTKIRKDNK